MSNQANPDSHLREVIEIQIPIPYGHLAAKWWGRQDVRPILCVHGWQDNAGSFDPLIPLLPDHVGYLAIDLPGHGKSSRLPAGMIYTGLDNMYILNYVVRQFGWRRVSLLAHSMGAIMAFAFASAFPERVDMVIALDGLQPRVMRPVHTDFLLPGLEMSREADARNVAGTEPPTYTVEELVEKMNSQSFLTVTRSAAMHLLARGVAESATHPDRYYFTRDNRLKVYHFLMYTAEINESLAKNIDCPFLFIKCLQAPVFDTESAQNAILEIMMEKPNFHMHTADGVHHVHLTQPHLVSAPVSEFLLKYAQTTREDHGKGLDSVVVAKL